MNITNTVHNVNAETALILVTAAVEKATEIGAEITACVVDVGGFVMAQWCTNNARFQTKDFAYYKAYTAVYMQSDTTEWYNKIKDNAQVCQALTNRDSRFMVLAGGVPLTHNGNIIGAIGISGGTPDQDMTIAHHAIATSGI